jgi:hypothetical protein
MKAMPTVLRREAGPVTVKPEQAKVSVYFNVDNGTGKIRGVFMQENEAVAPIFESWMRPFKDLGMTVLTMRNTGDQITSRSTRLAFPGSSSSRTRSSTTLGRTTPTWMFMTSCNPRI